jgi:hypothetical protein
MRGAEEQVPNRSGDLRPATACPTSPSVWYSDRCLQFEADGGCHHRSLGLRQWDIRSHPAGRIDRASCCSPKTVGEVLPA